MLNKKKIVVVMPAYNASRTLEATYRGLDQDVIDDVLLVDDSSDDETVKVARRLGIKSFLHKENRGYGANQKSCYALALREGADIVIMVHPDYQYDPRLATAMAGMLASGVYDCVIGSRIIGGGALKGGMPFYKYIANRALTLIENVLIRQKLSEFHTGYRAFTRELLLSLPLIENSDDFLFDNQMLAQIVYFGFKIGEISCPTKYFGEASSINFSRSCRYGLGVLAVSIRILLSRFGLREPAFLHANGRKLRPDEHDPDIVEVSSAPA
jgi:glycosyltransferase involved in cell wall biosynthesis